MLNNNEYQIGTIVTLKKPHPSGTVEWKVVRLGADIKIVSTIKPTLFLMFTRREFNKKVLKIVSK